jgi:uncharacterized Fe-S cluster-containing radical SAM superfamily protein
MHIRGLGLYYTMKCNASCAHCGVWSGPDRSERMSLEQASGYIEQLAEHAQPDVVVFVGGEPLLHRNDICRLIKLAKSHGIATQVSTNGFWASTEDRAQRMVEALAEAGLDHLAMSADSFHWDFIDPQNIGRAMRAARGYGMTRKLQVIRSAVHDEGDELFQATGIDPEEVVDHSVFKRHRRDPTFDAARWIIMNRHPVAPFGRGAFLSNHVVHEALDSLEDVPCFMVRRFPIVYPNGDLFTCCCTAGFYKEYFVGNLERETLPQLDARMDEDGVFDAIARVGPVALAKSVRAAGTDIGEEFANPCHACRQTLTKTPRETLESHARGLLALDAVLGNPETQREFEELV